MRAVPDLMHGLIGDTYLVNGAIKLPARGGFPFYFSKCHPTAAPGRNRFSDTQPSPDNPLIDPRIAQLRFPLG